MVGSIIHSPRSWEYSSAGHPESPVRVKGVYLYLKRKGFSFTEPSPAQEEDVLLVHSRELLDKVKGENFYEPDTPSLPGIFDYAMLSCGAAILASGKALEGEASFSLMRPPGHHATKSNLGGFCYFNNIAVAVKKAVLKGKKAAVLDIDCHHGNGTEDIFLGQENVLYVSLHQSPLYPGTGLSSRENCLNFPLYPGTREEKYLDTLESALEEIGKFSPDLLAVSVGFDTYMGDPLTDIDLDKQSYCEIGKMIASSHKNRFSILEGGYSKDLPECVYQFLKGFF